MRIPPLGAALFALSLTFMCSTARAYEDQWGVALGAGYHLALDREELRQGGGLGAIVDYGLSDVLSVRARLDYGFLPGGPGDALHRSQVGAELVYAIDVLTTVPFLGLGLDLVGVTEDRRLDVHPAAHLVAGFDYLLSRELSLGIDLRGLLAVSPWHRHPLALQTLLVVRYVLDR